MAGLFIIDSDKIVRYQETKEAMADRESIHPRFIIPYHDLQFAKEETFLGEGNAAEVNSATYKGRKIAYKKYSVRTSIPENKRRFYREANMLLQLNNPNIVHCFGATTDKRFGIVMEHAGVLVKMNGEEARIETLKQFLTCFDEPPSFKIRLVCLHQVCKALDYLHHYTYQTSDGAEKENPICHGDIKSDNVLLFQSNSKNPYEIQTKNTKEKEKHIFNAENTLICKLGDFGSSEFCHTHSGVSETKKERQKFIATTAPFCPPEIFLQDCDNNVNSQSKSTIRTDQQKEQSKLFTKEWDIYSLSMLMYEILKPKVRYPWAEEIPTLNYYEIKEKVINGERPNTDSELYCAPEEVKKNFWKLLKEKLLDKKSTLSGNVSDNILRGDDPSISMAKFYIEVMESCWQQNPEDRPPIEQAVELIGCLIIPFISDIVIDGMEETRGEGSKKTIDEKEMMGVLLANTGLFFAQIIKEINGWDLDNLGSAMAKVAEKAKEMKQREKKATISGIAGNSTSILAGIGGVVGFGLMFNPFTLPVGLIVVYVSASVGVAGGFTAGGAELVKTLQNRADDKKLFGKDGSKVNPQRIKEKAEKNKSQKAQLSEEANVSADFNGILGKLAFFAIELKEVYACEMDEILHHLQKFLIRIWEVIKTMSLPEINVKIDGAGNYGFIAESWSNSGNFTTIEIIGTGIVSSVLSGVSGALRIGQTFAMQGIDASLDVGTGLAKVAFPSFSRGAQALASIGFVFSVINIGVGSYGLYGGVKKVLQNKKKSSKPDIKSGSINTSEGNDNISKDGVDCDEGYQNNLADVLEYYVEAMMNFKLWRERAIDYQEEYKRRLQTLQSNDNNAHQ